MNTKFKISNIYISTETIDVFVDDTCVGILQHMAVAPEQLQWIPDDRVDCTQFPFDDDETFLILISDFRNYKNEHGYKYLTIWSHNNGFVAQLDEDLLLKAGFRHLPKMHPACMILY